MLRLIFGSPKKILKSSTEGFTFLPRSMKRWFESQSLVTIILWYLFQTVLLIAFDLPDMYLSFWLIIPFLI